MNKEDFIKEQKEFIKVGGYSPEDLGSYYDLAEKSHAEVRKALGGNFITLKSDINILENLNTRFNKELQEIQTNIPKYFSEYKLQYADILKANLPLYKGIRTCKHVIHYCKKIKISPSKTEKIVKTLEKIQKDLSDLNKASKNNYAVTIDTRQFVFSLLGSLGIDNSSCMKQGKRHNEEHKYIIGIWPGSFVGLIHNADFDPENLTKVKDNRNIIGRFIGFYNDKRTTFFNSSYDYLKTIPPFQDLVLDTFKKITKQNLFYFPQGISFTGRLNYYHGPYGHVATADPKMIKFDFPASLDSHIKKQKE